MASSPGRRLPGWRARCRWRRRARASPGFTASSPISAPPRAPRGTSAPVTLCEQTSPGRGPDLLDHRTSAALCYGRSRSSVRIRPVQRRRPPRRCGPRLGRRGEPRAVGGGSDPRTGGRRCAYSAGLRRRRATSPAARSAPRQSGRADHAHPQRAGRRDPPTRSPARPGRSPPRRAARARASASAERRHPEQQVEDVRGGQAGHGRRADVRDAPAPLPGRGSRRARRAGRPARATPGRGRRAAAEPDAARPAARPAANGTSRRSHSASTAAASRCGLHRSCRARRRRPRGAPRRRLARRSGRGRRPRACRAARRAAAPARRASAWTTTTSGNCAAIPPSTSSGMSCTTMLSSGAAAISSVERRRTSGWTIAVERRPRRGVVEHHGGERRAVELPSAASTPAPNASTTAARPGGARRDDLAGEPVGVDEHRAALDEPRRDGRLARPDAPGQPHPQHVDHAYRRPISPHAGTGCGRARCWVGGARAPAPGIVGSTRRARSTSMPAGVLAGGSGRFGQHERDGAGAVLDGQQRLPRPLDEHPGRTADRLVRGARRPRPRC